MYICDYFDSQKYLTNQKFKKKMFFYILCDHILIYRNLFLFFFHICITNLLLGVRSYSVSRIVLVENHVIDPQLKYDFPRSNKPLFEYTAINR